MPEVTEVVTGEAKTGPSSDARTLALNPKNTGKNKISAQWEVESGYCVIPEREREGDSGSLAP